MELSEVRMFLKVAELGSFTRAAQHLGVSKARVSLGIGALESEVGSRLLSRTTRAVRLTPDGEQFFARARRLVLDADALGSLFQSPSTLRGSVRVDLPVEFARTLVIPRLPEFLAAHPQLSVMLSTTDRRVDVVREGFDCVLRIGALPDSGLTARKLGSLPMINCASPAYLHEYGTPRSLDDLRGHLIVNYALTFGADEPSFEYPDGDGYSQWPMRSTVTVNGSDSYHAACLAGLGIIQAPRHGMLASLASGALIEVLPEHRCAPMPVSLVHAHARQVPARVRAVLTWLANTMAPHLDPS
ncbi:MAG TPA: LysR family transcriptional regulator [Polyangiaceae bacterium]|nr:LysR family transcriptional regulator [Polyangiaceae bacterium]